MHNSFNAVHCGQATRNQISWEGRDLKLTPSNEIPFEPFILGREHFSQILQVHHIDVGKIGSCTILIARESTGASWIDRLGRINTFYK